MSRYALVHEGVVANIVNEKPDGRFFEPGLTWVEIKENQVVEEGYLYVDGKFKRKRGTLDQEKMMAVQMINAYADKVYDAMTASYPRSELATFYRQELEVERWTRGDNRVPFLRTIAERRKLPIEELMRRVAYKAEIIAPILAVPFADRQAFEDEILACKTLDQLDGVLISISKWMSGGR